MHGQSAARQLDGDGGRQRRLADAALAHQHHQAMTIGGDAVDQLRQARRIELDRLASLALAGAAASRRATAATRRGRRD